jgi:NADH dehydrogenase (ubiquinone) Fe-S protein 6
LLGLRQIAIGDAMQSAPETTIVTSPRVVCDGASEIPGGAALGHPRVFLEIDESGFVDCGYCDRRFVLKGGAAAGGH